MHEMPSVEHGFESSISCNTFFHVFCVNRTRFVNEFSISVSLKILNIYCGAEVFVSAYRVQYYIPCTMVNKSKGMYLSVVKYINNNEHGRQ